MRHAGQRILVVDDSSKSRCSRVAAGLINPIGGKRLKLIWNADLLIPHARSYYQQLAQRYHQTFFHPLPIRREFANPQEAKIWGVRQNDPAHQRWVDSSDGDHFSIPDAGYLDTNTLLDTLHQHFQTERCLLYSAFDYSEIDSGPKGITFRGHQAKHAIFAEGHLATHNPHFRFIPYKPAKGIIATIKLKSSAKRPCAGISENSHILIKGKFIIPRHDGAIQVGATYNWDDASDTPDENGIHELEQFLDSHFGKNEWTFDTVKAGVRPATAGAYPVVGPHPENPCLHAFNGFGSKGSLQIPFFAETLATYLKAMQTAESSRPNLPTETLPSRFIKTPSSKPKRWLATNVAKAAVLHQLVPGDIAIDATAGNGHDTHWLAQAVAPNGHVFAFDIQEKALSATQQRLQGSELSRLVSLHNTGHQNLLETVPPKYHGKISAIVFNLGFLPGGDPSVITKADTTIVALKASLRLLKPSGILASTLYPSHSGAQEEVELVLSWFRNLDPAAYETRIEPHPQNNPSSPYPIFVTKK